jgi:hypothetical protein
VLETIKAASDAVERYAEEARALHGPAEAEVFRDDLVGELERAGRAHSIVEHGATIQLQARKRGRELEAQTSIKRGYLNLLHAREAIARYAAQAEEVVTRLPPPAPERPAAPARGPRA